MNGLCLIKRLQYYSSLTHNMSSDIVTTHISMHTHVNQITMQLGKEKIFPPHSNFHFNNENIYLYLKFQLVIVVEKWHYVFTGIFNTDTYNNIKIEFLVNMVVILLPGHLGWHFISVIPKGFIHHRCQNVTKLAFSFGECNFCDYGV